MLHIDTFSHIKGGHSFFKALGHPLAAEKMQVLLSLLGEKEAIALYDPSGWLQPLSELYDLNFLKIEGVFVQKYEDFGRDIKGHKAQAVSHIGEKNPATLLVLDFGLKGHLSQIGRLLPETCEVFSLDDIKIPQAFLTHPQDYLNPLNFATNFSFFREKEGLHTRLFTANYWSIYSGKPAHAWLRLLDEKGNVLATWEEPLNVKGASFVVNSQDVKKRFDLPDFCGQLFIHIIDVAGHDVVKYALDTYSDDGETLSCTHDANAWPADYYAGLPAPQVDEKIVLWIQNSHPCPIPSGSVGLNPMGRDEGRIFLNQEIPPFGSFPLDVASLLPDLHWPQQIEIFAGKHFVRPRYEVVKGQKRRIAHANVERTDLKPDPTLKELAPYFGKGFILPAPILPWDQWQSETLPTPMARDEQHLPVALLVYDSEGQKIGEHRFGNLARSDSVSVIVNKVLENALTKLKSMALGSPIPTYGHMEMVYDFDAGEEANGWLHGLFRYDNKVHQAETIFGAHIFNTAITYKDQPFSYRGSPPGLTTRLFLRSGIQGTETMCHLIYPASTPWHTTSSTQLILHNGQGECITESLLNIPCGGSRFWRMSELFSEKDIEKAGPEHYVIIRDATCRLFGYHGAIDLQGRFSLDHMFGF